MVKAAEPVIADALVSPGHDGAAVLVLRIEFENGATDTVTLDAERASRVFDACETTSPAGLRGQSWKRLLTALEN